VQIPPAILHTPQSAVGSPVTPADLAAWQQLIALQVPFYQRAVRKRAFSFQARSDLPARIPFTPGRIASLFIPTTLVWMGGDDTLTNQNGLPVLANVPTVFGPEEGDSWTYLIGQAITVDVRCFELLVK